MRGVPFQMEVLAHVRSIVVRRNANEDEENIAEETGSSVPSDLIVLEVFRCDPGD